MTTKKATHWTAEEINILCKHYAYMAAAHIQKMLPRHTLSAIYRKAYALGLRAYNRTIDFAEYIRKNFGVLSYQQMADELGCSKQSIAYRVKRLRLSF